MRWVCIVSHRLSANVNLAPIGDLGIAQESVELSLTSYVQFRPTWLDTVSILFFFAFFISNNFRNVRKVLRQHKLRWTRSRVVLQELPRQKVRTKGIRIRWRCRLLVHGQRRSVQERRVSRRVSCAFDVFSFVYLFIFWLIHRIDCINKIIKQISCIPYIIFIAKLVGLSFPYRACKNAKLLNITYMIYLCQV